MMVRLSHTITEDPRTGQKFAHIDWTSLLNNPQSYHDLENLVNEIENIKQAFSGEDQ